jgi:N-carbamoyl-L-amino-acid hydrolase
MLAAVQEQVRIAAKKRGCESRGERVWRIDPTSFDRELVELARSACSQLAGSERTLTSGALHDAAALARVIPAAMVFCPSRRGLSHTPEEDTAEEDLSAGIAAFGELAAQVLRRG